MTTREEETGSYDVVIVGGGPVGMALAVDLGQRGVSCAVVERNHDVGHIPKGQNLTSRTLEHFYFWGCVDELRAARLLPPGYPIGGVTAYGSLMSEYWYASSGRDAVAPYYFQANDRLPQYLTERVLRARLAQLPSVTVFFGWTATSVRQHPDDAVVTVEDDGAPAGTHTLRARYVVGCDGARSLVREEAGIDRDGPSFDEKMVLTVFRSTSLHDGLRRFPPRTTYRVLDPDLRGYWQFFGRVDVGEEWFFHSPIEKDVIVDEQYVHHLLERAAGFPISCEFEYIGVWDLRIEVASRYREGRVFIAGDACHSHPPYGAFGLNSGLEDVTNLGWKLGALIDGWGGDHLLDSYSEERQPVFVETGEAVIAGNIARDRAFLETYRPSVDADEFARRWTEKANEAGGSQSFEPHYEGSSVVLGPPSATIGVRDERSFLARPGHHLAPQSLSSGRNIFEELSSGFTLVDLGSSDDAGDGFAAAAARLGVPLRVIKDTYEGDRAAYGARLILVRPDQFVAWAGDAAPADLDAILHTVTGMS